MPDSASPSSSSSDSLPASAESGKRTSCRVCSDEEDLFARMRQKIYSKALRKEGGGGEGGGGVARTTKGRESRSTESSQPSSEKSQPPLPSSHSSLSSTAAASAVSSSSSSSPTPSSSSSTSPSSLPPPYLSAGRPLPCPPDATRLGRATWTFLHSVAAYFPARPSPVQSRHALALLHSLPHLYPCPHCAAHLSSFYQQHRPEEAVQSRDRFGLFLCQVHNDVRQRQGKRMFDCGRWRERWGGEDWEEEFGEERTKCREEEYADVEEEQTDGE